MVVPDPCRQPGAWVPNAAPVAPGIDSLGRLRPGRPGFSITGNPRADPGPFDLSENPTHPAQENSLTPESHVILRTKSSQSVGFHVGRFCHDQRETDREVIGFVKPGSLSHHDFLIRLARPMWADPDFDFPLQSFEKSEQFVGGEPAEMPIHQV